MAGPGREAQEEREGIGRDCHDVLFGPPVDWMMPAHMGAGDLYAVDADARLSRRRSPVHTRKSRFTL